MGATRIELPHWESIDLLGRETIGRVCVIEGGFPLAFPINYRVVTGTDPIRIVFRTSPHTAVARSRGPASFEVDHVDPDRRNAWSVIARGELRRVEDLSGLPDPHTILDERHHWMIFEATTVSGRRFTSVSSHDDFSVEWQAVGN